MLLIKIVIGALLLFVFFNLFKAMMIMLKGDSDQPMSKFIGRRLIASVIVLALIMFAIGTGLITPNPKPY